MDTVDNKQTFQTMRDRMDALIDARRTQPDKRAFWNRMNTALREMATNPDDIKYLHNAFMEIEQQERMDNWDNQFFEALITSDELDEFTVPLKANPYAGPAVPFPGQIISTTDNTSAPRTLNATQARVADRLGIPTGDYAKIIDALATKENI